MSLFSGGVPALGDSCGGGATKQEVPVHRVASPSDVNKAVVL